MTYILNFKGTPIYYGTFKLVFEDRRYACFSKGKNDYFQLWFVVLLSYAADTMMETVGIQPFKDGIKTRDILLYFTQIKWLML